MSRLWLELVTEPFDLLVFDHHTDMQEPAFGGILSCGGWVRAALEELPLLHRVYLAGPPAAVRRLQRKRLDLRGESPGYGRRSWGAGKAGGNAARERRRRWECVRKGGLPAPLYLCGQGYSYAGRRRDQLGSGAGGAGRAPACVRAAFGGRRVIGMDVCGEAPGEEAAAKRNDRANGELCVCNTDEENYFNL